LAALFFVEPHVGILVTRFSKEAKMSEIAAVHCEREHAYTYAAQSVARLCDPGVGRPGRRNAHLCTRRGAGIGASIQRYSSDSVAACDFLARLPVRSSVGGLRRGTSIAAQCPNGCAHSGQHAACLRARSRRPEKRREYRQHNVCDLGRDTTWRLKQTTSAKLLVEFSDVRGEERHVRNMPLLSTS
jgi:hypothetical protein